MRKAVVFALAAALVLIAIAATLYFFLRPGPLHAVGLDGVALADAPAGELGDDVRLAQADQAGNPGVHAGEALAVAGGAGRDRLGGISGDDERLAACHGKGLTGMEPGIPGLVGLRQTYIVGQLTSWRVGERNAVAPDCMKRIVARMSDADITAVAAWLASQEAPSDLSPESSNLVRMPFACGSQR